MSDKIKLTEASQTKTTDNMNLIEIPFCLLSRRNNREITSFRHDWIADGKEFYYEVIASAKYGMPTFSAEELLLALMNISYQEQYINQTVHCTAYQILKLLKWGDSKRAYNRLIKTFSQLAGMLIDTNYFWDPFSGRRIQINQAMHIIDEFKFDSQDNLFGIDVNFFAWGKTFWENLKLGYNKLLDYKTYQLLNSPIAKRLFRYLDKQLNQQEGHKIGMENLCYRILNMTKARKLADLKQRLKPAIEELNNLKIGFHIDIKPGKTGDIIYFRKTNTE